MIMLQGYGISLFMKSETLQCPSKTKMGIGMFRKNTGSKKEKMV